MSQTSILSNEMLKGVLSDALVCRGDVADLNECRLAGIYRIRNETLNRPQGVSIGSILICLPWDVNTVYHVVLYLTGMTYRVTNGRNGWNPWRKLSETSMS